MRISVKVKPNSKRPHIEMEADGSLTVYVKSAPIEGRANEELIASLARRFGVPKSGVRVRSGLASRMKIVEIDRTP